jgi:hypothetical protein
MLRAEFPLASPEDMALPECVEEGLSIQPIIRQHYER